MKLRPVEKKVVRETAKKFMFNGGIPTVSVARVASISSREINARKQLEQQNRRGRSVNHTTEITEAVKQYIAKNYTLTHTSSRAA